MFFILLFLLNSIATFSNSSSIPLNHQLETLIGQNPHSSLEQKSLQNALNALKSSTVDQVNEENFLTLKNVHFCDQIIPRYLKTKTFSGYLQACTMALEFTHDLQKLIEKQDRIRLLDQHPDILNTLKKNISAIQPIEEEFLSLFETFNGEQQQAYQNMQNKVYVDLDPKEAKDFYNKQPLILDMTQRLNFLLPFMAVAANSMNVAIALNKEEKIPFFTAWAKAIPILLTIPFRLNDDSMSIAQKTDYLLTFFSTIISLRSLHNAIKENLTIIYNKQVRLIKIATMLRSIQTLGTMLQKDTELKKLFNAEITMITEFFNPDSTTTSKSLKEFIALIMSNSFIGSPSYYFSQQGKILTTHYYLDEHKADLLSLLQVVGAIDAYIAITKLYQDLQSSDTPICMPTFIQSSEPILHLQNYWHPLVNADTIVTNDLMIGSPYDVKNLIITGPNAGGKTTSLTALAINIIFAQAFGISPCSTCTMTPFAKIHSYLDITTNIQEGLSLFAAQIDRAKKLKDSILSCNTEEKSITIMDEIFSGTNPAVAANLGAQFASQLSAINHNITIITTHFPELTELEKTHCFTNYKVADATINDDGSLTYPFKLIPGISCQNIARHMLEHEGII